MADKALELLAADEFAQLVGDAAVCGRNGCGGFGRLHGRNCCSLLGLVLDDRSSLFGRRFDVFGGQWRRQRRIRHWHCRPYRRFGLLRDRSMAGQGQYQRERRRG
jgi:hypothetical protein